MTKIVFESTATQHLASKHIFLNNKKKTNKKEKKNRNSANHDHNIIQNTKTELFTNLTWTTKHTHSLIT